MTPTGKPAAPSAGYSGTPLHRKLGIKPGARIGVRALPPLWPIEVLDPQQETAAVVVDAPDDAEPFDVVLQFCPNAAALAHALSPAMNATAIGGRCWIAWPKKSGPSPSDLSEDDVRAAALEAGWVDVKVCAVDVTWSGLCLMRRTRSAR